jgi:hypothetical protein
MWHVTDSCRSISAFKKPPKIKPFRELPFLQHLIDTGKKTKEMELYRKFIRTQNFVHWFKNRKRQALHNIRNKYVHRHSYITMSNTREQVLEELRGRGHCAQCKEDERSRSGGHVSARVRYIGASLIMRTLYSSIIIIINTHRRARVSSVPQLSRK